MERDKIIKQKSQEIFPKLENISFQIEGAQHTARRMNEN